MMTYDEIHELINHPDVRPYLAPPELGDIDVTARLRGAVFFGDRLGGGCLFIPLDEEPLGLKIYELHFLFTKACRGKHALAVMRAAMAHVFTAYDAGAIVGAIPLTHRTSRLMIASLRFEKKTERPDSFGQPCAVYVLERKRWAT